jgi:hypothetical protein
MSDRYDTTPEMEPVPPPHPHGHGPAYGAAPGQGGPAYGAPPPPGAAAYGASAVTSPDYSPRPVAIRRPDVLAALFMILAGAAAGISLLLRWLTTDDATGLDLVRRGLDDLGVGFGELIDTGFWQPLIVVVGGGVLLVLGLLAFVPARRHRALGLIALLVTGAVAAAVLVPLVQADWDLGVFDLGFWFAVGVAVLGLLGSLKAVFTGHKEARDDRGHYA